MADILSKQPDFWDYRGSFCLEPRRVSPFNALVNVKLADSNDVENPTFREDNENKWTIQTDYNFVQKAGVPIVLGAISGGIEKFKQETTRAAQKAKYGLGEEESSEYSKRSVLAKLKTALNTFRKEEHPGGTSLGATADLISTLFELSQPGYTLFHNGVKFAEARSKNNRMVIRIVAPEFLQERKCTIERTRSGKMVVTYGSHKCTIDKAIRPSSLADAGKTICGWQVRTKAPFLERMHLELFGHKFKALDVFHSRRFCLSPLMAVLVYDWERNGTVALLSAIVRSRFFSIIGAAGARLTIEQALSEARHEPRDVRNLLKKEFEHQRMHERIKEGRRLYAQHSFM